MTKFKSHPDPSTWDEYVDYESKSWPRKDRRRYWIIPSICFNCESACGILSYVDKETLDVRKIEGNPVHPGGRPGEDGFANRVLQTWGVDGHNSHTNVCSSSARLGHFLWCGADRPSPDHTNAQTILLLSSHLESGHYFNPHAQRIIEGQSKGATLIVIDPRLSNTSAKADLWLPAYSGTEGALLLAMARLLLEEGLYDREFVRNWVDWRGYLRAERPELAVTFDSF